MPKDKRTAYEEILEEARQMTRSASAPESGEIFSLEEILSEFGGGRERRILQEAEGPSARKDPASDPAEAAPPEESAPVQAETAAPLPEEAPAAPPPEREGKVLAFRRPAGQRLAGKASPAPEGRPAKVLSMPTASLEPPEEPETPEPPAAKGGREETPPAKKRRVLTIEEVVSDTVDAVREEQREEQEVKRRRGMFSKKPRRAETEEQSPYDPPEAASEEEWDDEDLIGPEPPLTEASAEARRDWLRHRRTVPLAAAAAVFLAIVFILDQQGYALPLWRESLRFQTGLQLGCLAVAALCCRDVFARAFALLRRGRCSADLAASLAAFAAAADCAARIWLPERTDVMPYVLPACAALTAAQWGLSRRDRGQYDMFRAASITDDPPYLVADSLQGARKQRGKTEGFYTAAEKDDLSMLWQAALMPLILMGTLVFAGLCSLGEGQKADFFLCWSAILSGAASLALPLAWGLPWSRLSRRLQKSGCALAGWAGAGAVSRRRTAILTEADLFPPGAVKLKPVRTLDDSIAYAASMVRASGSGGLFRLFDEQLRGEGGQYYDVDNFQFYKDGGFAGTIRGVSVLMGTAPFMRKMNVRLPPDLKLRTGLYVAADKELLAIFALKYEPGDNVDWALRLLKRNGVTSILASRDPNITPTLVKRKFYKGARVEYPAMELRLALSDQGAASGRPRALLQREGLLPYAETVIGALRLRKCALDCTLFSLLGSAAGTLITYYLVHQEAFSMMPPLMVLAFSALWAVPVLLISLWASAF